MHIVFWLFSQWLNTVPAGLEQVSSLAWLQLPGVPNNLRKDCVHTLKLTNISDRHHGSRMSCIVCDLQPLKWVSYGCIEMCIVFLLLMSSLSLSWLSLYTEWPKLSENVALYDCVIVDLMPLNFTYLHCWWCHMT